MNDKTRTQPPAGNQNGLSRGLKIGAGLGVVILVAVLIALRSSPKGPYQKPPATGDGWATASLSQVGMDEQPVIELLNLLAKPNEHKIDSLVVVKDGKLVFETYYPGSDITLTDQLTFTKRDFDRETRHCLASSTKSVTSLMFGIAMDQGKISSVDEHLYASFPEYAGSSSALKDQVTFRQMLTMTSGLFWDENSYPYSDSRNTLAQMVFSPDPVGYMLAQPLSSMPGEAWFYNSGTTNLLGAVVNRKTGTPLAEYAAEKLFKPLGITSYQWQGFPQAPQMAVSSSLLYLRPRDMAKLGQLVLQQGKWNGKQVVSAEWLRESTAASVSLPVDYGPGFQNTGYGYQWWHGTFAHGNTEVIYSAGWGGQFIFIMPSIQTVVVMTGSNFDQPFGDMFNIVNQYILGAMK